MSTQKPSPDTSDMQQVKDITADIERTRSEMSATITAIEHRLSPAELADQAKIPLEHLEARVKALVKEGLAETKVVLEGQIEAAKGAVHEQLLEAKELVHGQIEEAKTAVKDQLHEAKDIVTEGLSQARQAVKEDIHAAIATTKQSIRDATIGRVENFATKAGDVMHDTKDTLVDTIRQNPIPAALAGIGIVWLFMNRNSSARRRAAIYDPTGAASGMFDGAGRAVGHAAGRVAQGASNLVQGVGSAIGGAGGSVAGAAHDASIAVRQAVGQGVDAASHFVGQTTDAAGQLATSAGGVITSAAHTARDQAMRAERSLAGTLDTNPLALGAVALAAGAVVGYSLPRTDREDALLGGLRDQVLHGASDLAHDAATSLHHLTEQAGDTAREALSATSSK